MKKRVFVLLFPAIALSRVKREDRCPLFPNPNQGNRPLTGRKASFSECACSTETLEDAESEEARERSVSAKAEYEDASTDAYANTGESAEYEVSIRLRIQR